jgi:hypothetical protein
LYCGNVESADMTLIASVWSPEGFAISADGLQVETGKPPKYEAQKIFQSSFRNGTGFALACSGTCQIGFGPDRSFDFIERAQWAIDELAAEPFPSEAADYFNEIGQRLFSELAYSISDPEISESRLLFVGYGNGITLWAEIVFSNTGTRFYPPVLARVTRKPRQFIVFAGSTTVYGDMQVAGKLFQPLSLQEAIDMVREYAQTCVESSKSVEDCSNLGGHIHVATVTKDGFKWIVPPIGPLSM